MFARTILSMMCFYNMTACGGTAQTNVPNVIDPEFQPYYDSFIQQANDAGLGLNSNQGITIAFATLGQKNSLGETIGECSNIGFGNSTIVIDPNYWKSLVAKNTQILLIYHELGHCVLGEDHTPDQENIMNALINNPEQYMPLDLDDMVNKLYKQYGSGV